MREQKASVEVNLNAQTLTFSFASGHVLEAALGILNGDLVTRLALHGLEQKLRDSYAGAKASEAFAFAKATWDTLVVGDWSKRGTGALREEPNELLAKAVHAVLVARGKDVSLPKVLASIDGLDRSARAKLRAVPEVAAELARLRGGSSSVLDSLLG